jgi:hypothetical protein
MDTFILVPEREFNKMQGKPKNFDDSMSLLLKQPFQTEEDKATALQTALADYQRTNLPKKNFVPYQQEENPIKVSKPLTPAQRVGMQKALVFANNLSENEESDDSDATLADVPLKTPAKTTVKKKPFKAVYSPHNLRKNPKPKKQFGTGKLTLWKI